MPYATLQKLCSHYGYRELSQLLCDEDDLLTRNCICLDVHAKVTVSLLIDVSCEETRVLTLLPLWSG